MQLHNKYDRRILKEKIQNDTTPRTTLSFYQYANIESPEDFRNQLYIGLDMLQVLGRIYVSYEGINAQVSVPTENIEKLREYLYSIDFLNGIRLNIAIDDDGKSFFKLAIKLRKKIVADGLNDETFDVTNKGEYLNAQAFNELTDKENPVIIDMRNHYESEVGHFKGAILPDVDTFRDAIPMVEKMLEDKKDQPIIMYCTGGIRCEKASAYFKHKGFSRVYHIEGGIIEYARQVKALGIENKFIGKNFVFDERLGERISDDIISSCHQCGKPCDTHVNCANDACHLLFIQCNECAEKMAGTCSTDCYEFLHLPIEKQKEMRKGIDKGSNIFNKAKQRLRPLLEKSPIKNKD